MACFYAHGQPSTPRLWTGSGVGCLTLVVALLPQVTDIYKKEDAKYARFTLMTMLLHGYQGRAGILTAGNYGTPQVC